MFYFEGRFWGSKKPFCAAVQASALQDTAEGDRGKNPAWSIRPELTNRKVGSIRKKDTPSQTRTPDPFTRPEKRWAFEDGCRLIWDAATCPT